MESGEEEVPEHDPYETLDAVYQTLSEVLNSLSRENAMLHRKQDALKDEFAVLLKRAEEYEEMIKKMHDEIRVLNAKIAAISKQFTAAMSKLRN